MQPKIMITLPGYVTREVDFGTTIIDALEIDNGSEPPLAAIVNGETVELFTPIIQESTIKPVYLTDRSGFAIYARSMCFLLVIAVKEVLKDATVTIEHSINNEIYGTISYSRDVTEKDILEIKEKMFEIVRRDEKIEKVKVKKDEAAKIFASAGMHDKLTLLKYANYEYISLYKCMGSYDYFYGSLVSSMGALKSFDLVFFENGFLIMLPEKKDPGKIAPFSAIPKLRATFDETKRWAKILEISNVGSINDKLAFDYGRDMILVAEGLHEKKISRIADAILENIETTKLVLIAGPSSSGKTTFSKRLSIQLRVLGLEPCTIAADDYFVDREHTPIDEDGNTDFESIKAVDTALLNDHLNKLLNREEIDMVKFNFLTGQRELAGWKYRMNDKSILIVEGIHGLNEKMTYSIPKDHKYKIYVSALTHLNLDNHSSVYVSDVRTLRRIIRDNRSRGADAETTLLSWPSVRKGEEKNIFPYQEEADVMFNSALLYEINVLKKYAEPLLEEINRESPVFIEANRMLKLLRFFQSAEDRYIPQNSIIKEFIGGSCFE